MGAVWYKHTEVAEYLLPKTDINIKDKYGCTALMLACWYNNVTIVRALLRDPRLRCLNWKINDTSYHLGCTPIMDAVFCCHIELVKLLCGPGLAHMRGFFGCL